MDAVALGETGSSTPDRPGPGRLAASSGVADAGVRLHLLGPVELLVDGVTVELGPPKQRTLFAALAVDANRPVPLKKIIDRVWDEPTPGARSSAYAHVAHLRRILRGVTRPGAIDILAGSGGYTLRMDADRADLHRYRSCCSRAADTALSPSDRADLYMQAMRMWHGDPLGGVASGWAATVRAGLVTQHLGVLVQWARCELLCGRAGVAADTLGAVAEQYPFSESLLEALMQALAGDGRSAEALDLYARRRRRFAEQLGVEPGRRLTALHTAILRDELPPMYADPVLPPGGGATLPPTAASAPSTDVTRAPLDEVPPARSADVEAAEVEQPGAPGRSWPPVPRQLPLDTAGFLGREAELAALDRFLDAPDAGTGRVYCICGTAGVGKTALAVRWAHRVADRFPDGQLYLDLRGFSPDRPLRSAEALEMLLRAVQGDAARLPPRLDERAAQLRTALAGRRVLLVLDNAASASQVRPLLPGGAGCFTVVTSRYRLASLVARDGAQRLEVTPLRGGAAVDLLRGLLRERAEAEPDAAMALARRCAGLPLALRLAAEMVLSRPHATLATLLTETDGEGDWLDLLDAGDDRSIAVRRVFSWSYRCLEPDSARAFRLLARHPGADIGERAAAAMLGTDLPTTRRLLRGLIDANLVLEVTPGRFNTHDLIRAYARELPGEPEAMARLLNHYLTAAAVTMKAIRPSDPCDYPIDNPLGMDPALEEPVNAMAWLHAERLNLLAAIGYAAEHGHQAQAVQLAATVRRYLELRGYYPDVAQAHRHALQAARELGDRRAEAIIHRNLGVVYGRANQNGSARQHFDSALALYREVDDRVGEAITLGNLGVLALRTSRVAEAERLCTTAIGVCMEHDLPQHMGIPLTTLGTLYTALGRYEDAIDYHARAIAGFSALGQWTAVSAAQDGLGETYRRLGRYEDALECLTAALEGARASGHRYGESAALINLGEVYRLTDRLDEAMECFGRAGRIAVELGDSRCEAGARNGTARVLLVRGQEAGAITELERALAAAEASEDSPQRVRALIGLALVAWQDVAAARGRLHQALELCTATEAHELGEIRDLLARLAVGDRARPVPA
jgi:DNA-binding SARP family transcriptional activator